MKRGQIVTGRREATVELRAVFQVAEATASDRYMHLFAEGDRCTVGPDDRLDFLRRYLLQSKAVPRIASPKYGFVDAAAFPDEELQVGA